MLKSLYEFGKYVDETEGIDEAFKKEFKTPDEDDKILKVSIDEEGNLHSNIIKVQTEVDIEDSSLYYIGGGGENVTGNQGIMGISPFFFQLNYLTKNKVSKSKGYYDRNVYEREIQELDKIKEYFRFIEENSSKIKDQLDSESDNPTWIYITEFNGESTQELHETYTDLYPRIKQNKDVEDIKDVCDICNKESTIRYPRIPFFSLDKGCYNHNMNRNDLQDARIKICRDCEAYITAGWKFLLGIFDRNYIMIPLVKDYQNKEKAFRTFIKTVRGKNLSNFDKINSILNNKAINRNLELYFAVYSKDSRGSFKNIERMIKNYKLYSIRFNPNENKNLRLLENDDETLRYVNYSNTNYNSTREIESFFDIEDILRSFFLKENGSPIFSHLYEFYYRDPPKKMNSKFKHKLYEYRDDLISFIYDCNTSAIDKKILRDIALNFILYEIRNKRNLFENSEYQDLNLKNEIMERINYYNFLNDEVINRGEDKMLKKQIEKVDGSFKKFEEEDKEEIREIVLSEENKQLLYYLIGNFIRKIDNTRGSEGKNKIFEDFISSFNKRNIKDRFQKQILQGQNYYIKGRNPKAKYVLDLIKYHLDDLFEDLPHGEVMISLITGYYSKDILESDEKKSNGDDENDE